MSEYFPEPTSSGRKVKVELDLSNYVTKADLKNATCVYISDFDKKTYLANLMSNVDKLDIDKFKNVPNGISSLKSKVDQLNIGKLQIALVDISKLTDLVKNIVVKKIEYNTNIKDIEAKIPDITNLATITTLNGKINQVKGEILNITNLATNSPLDAKINEVKDKMSSITNLATITPLTALEIKYLMLVFQLKKKWLQHKK